MDIGDWLRSLGLGQYEPAFRENAIDEAVLPNLTAEDLKDLGVGIVGHRRRLLDAIAALRAEASAPAPPSTAPPATDGLVKDAAERRRVTVMFSDLVGSTALSARIDAEDLREVISAYQKCVAETVRRFDGFIAKYMGDGALVYFGYPQAHEDDTERAVRAGLELIAAVAGLKALAPLQTRVGIATGLVVVGDLIGSGEARERGIVGETPNLAARLQGIAEPNTVVIAENTRRLLGNLFELQDLGARDLKGIARPVRAWTAVRPSSVESRFEALHATSLTALVGREEELELLLRRWSKAKSGEGQVVLLSGEAGIGKSRLTAALVDRLATQSHTRLRYFCSAQHTDSALYPIIGQMERAAGLAHDDAPQAKLDKFDAVLAQTATSRQDAALLAEMLSLPNDGRYPTLDLTPQLRRQRTLKALISQLEALAHQTPVLMMVEDIHWTDPTSLEVFSMIVGRIATLPVLLIVTFRPEFNPPWIGEPHVTALTINRLALREVGDIIDRVVGNKLFPASLRQEVIDRTDGIPLFVEEMTKAVLESESEGEARRTTAVVPSPALAVPASLHASLIARLDRLGLAKEVAQIGAAIGRGFSHALLAAAARMPEAELLSALDRLVGTGLLFRQGVPPQASYLFKHALVQDAAYGTLLREPRRALHARIAEILESQFADIAESQPELLARHCTDAGLAERAINYWLKAGQAAIQRSATAEALAQLNKGQEILASLSDSAVRDRLEIELQVGLGVVLMAAKGWAAPETGSANARARALCERLGETPRLFPVLYGQWVFHAVRAELAEAQEVGDEMLRRAEERGDVAAQVIAHRVLGTGSVLLGSLDKARTHFERGLALYDPALHRDLAFLYAQDPRVAGLSGFSWALLALGYPEQALSRSREALETARKLAHLSTQGYALLYASVFSQLSRDPCATQQLGDALAALAGEQGFPHYLGAAKVMRGWVLATETDDAESGLAQIQEGLAAWKATGAGFCVPYFLGLQAEAHARAGHVEEGLDRLMEALTLADKTGERWQEAELHRRRSELQRVGPGSDPIAVEASLRRAMEVAQSQGARLWELRAASALARFWAEHGEFREGRELLGPIYARFTEGHETADLRDAKALLDN
jgi:predicted ATPase/class 3 adenylate cyclase